LLAGIVVLAHVSRDCFEVGVASASVEVCAAPEVAAPVPQPELMQLVRGWVLEKFGEEGRAKGMKSDEEIFGKYSKKAHKQFYNELYAIDEATTRELRGLCREHALKFFDAFKSAGSAEKVKQHLNNRGLKATDFG